MQTFNDRSRARLGRLAGALAIALAAIFIFSIVLGPGNVLHGHTSSQTALTYAAEHGRLISLLGLLDGLINTVFAALIVLLIALSAGEGIVARVAYIAVSAAVALQWAHAGMLYALAELAQRGGADAGVLALFTLGSTMDESDSIVIPIAMACAGWLILRSRRLPAPVGWLSIGAAVVGLGATLPHFAGIDLGPVSVVSAWIFSIGIGVILLVKPFRTATPLAAKAGATA